MKKVTKIEENRNLQNTRPKLRVAAYCRVSTDSDAQLESLEAQKQHYENYILAHNDWTFAHLLGGIDERDALVLGVQTPFGVARAFQMAE